MYVDKSPKPQFFKFMGAVNVVDESNLDISKGECAEILNMMPDNTGEVASRPGYTSALAGSFHSLWSNSKDKSFVVSAGYLCSFNGTATTQIRLVHPSAIMAYAEVNDVVVATNGYDYVIIEDGIGYAADPLDEDHMISPPAGKHICFYNGRVYIARENVLYCTLPFNVDTCDERAYKIPITQDDITGIKATNNGIYVGTTKEIFFLSGDDPFAGEGFKLIKLADYGLISYCIAEVPCEDTEKKEDRSIVIMMMTHRGVCHGSRGSFDNKSAGVYSVPMATFGAPLVLQRDGKSHFVASLTDGDEYNPAIDPGITIDEQG